MARFYYKKKPCGCVVRAMVCGRENAPNNGPQVYLIGGHTHFVICNACKKEEDKDIDTLHYMWTNDNITNDFEFSGWTMTVPP